MRAGLYARVSTSDKEQDTEVQLAPLREFAAAQGWEIEGEYADEASAADLKGRRRWSALMSAASRRRVDIVAVWSLDRAFRSARHALNTMEELRSRGVAFRSLTQGWADTSTPSGSLLFTILAAVAEFERGTIRERVKAGMARARLRGSRIGRAPLPPEKVAEIRAARGSGMSVRGAARACGVSPTTVQKVMAGEARG